MSLMKNIYLKKLIYMIFSFLGAYILVDYLRFNTKGIVMIPVISAMYFFQKYKENNMDMLKKYKAYVLIFSGAISIVIVLCKHMVVDFYEFYSGISENYITKFKWIDFIALGVLIYEIMLISFGIIGLLRSKKIVVFFKEKKKVEKTKEKSFGIANRKMMVLLSVAMFICWSPYLIKYYPAIIYGDSAQSLAQAMGQTPYNSHHPIMYTLFIKACLCIGNLISNNTTGVALYSVIQMLVMCNIFSYSVCWLRKKDISLVVCSGVFLFFAIPRFWAQLAVSMWKDPIFSVLVFLFSLKLFDIIYSGGQIIHEKGFTFQCILCVFGISFSRNNGFYVIVFSLIVLIICSFVKKNRWLIQRKFIISMLISLVLVYAIQGPIYNMIGISSDPVESYGVPLQQVARTVVYNGKISKEEKKFLNELMPLEKYIENYSPGLVDHMKWSGDFDTDFFNGHQKEFIKIWISLFIKNPKLYFEAWELNTCGFWGVNYWELNRFTKNIVMGVPLDAEGKKAFQIKAKDNEVGKERISSYISLETPMLSVALCLWCGLWMIMLAFARKKARYIVLFAPCVGNILTLMLASPIAYWPRYGVSFLCLLPISIIFPFIMKPLKC